MEIFNSVVLGLSGLLFLMVGLTRLSNPIKNYEKNSGITLANDVNLLNEVRGVSAMMLLGAVLILLGIVIPKITLISTAIATLIFIGFAIGRIISMMVDGKPNKMLVQGLMFELVLGSLNVVCLVNALA